MSAMGVASPPRSEMAVMPVLSLPMRKMRPSASQQAPGAPVGSDAEVVNREDVGMRERSDGSGLALESRAVFRIARDAGREDLDGDLAIESRIFGAIDLAHSARAEGRQNLAGTEASTGLQGQRGSRDYKAMP
jgi:hypothetical protein